ncbi:MAG: formate dehydrogenase accessory sulfurtransferase FdhD [Smithellaceae bacterium]|nr:formate dehydrogenase accessory sulfurtransferase FdhD [Smithellaceae bacterium]
MESFIITTLHREGAELANQLIAEEVPLTIDLNGKELATLLCSPIDLKDLITGFLFTSGLIVDASSVRKIVIDEERWKASVEIETSGLPEEMVFKRVYTSGCGKGIIFHNPLDIAQRGVMPEGFIIDGVKLMDLMQQFLTSSEEHKLTRGVHSAALADGEGIVILRDDIGRHNALDKIIGAALATGLSLTDKVVLSSGRISSEILSKVLRAGLPILVSAGSPTNQAVKLARKVNLTLVGRARGNRLNVYSGGQRLGLEPNELT